MTSNDLRALSMEAGATTGQRYGVRGEGFPSERNRGNPTGRSVATKRLAFIFFFFFFFFGGGGRGGGVLKVQQVN